MSLNRFNPRRDVNEPEIRKRFAAHSWHTEQVSGKGMPDLFVWPRHAKSSLRMEALLVDVKMPKGKLKPAQEKKWKELAEKGIPVYVVRTEADVDALVEGTLEPWAPVVTGTIRAPRSHGDDRRVRIGKGRNAVDLAVSGYSPPRSKPVDSARDAEETFAPGSVQLQEVLEAAADRVERESMQRAMGRKRRGP